MPSGPREQVHFRAEIAVDQGEAVFRAFLMGFAVVVPTMAIGAGVTAWFSDRWGTLILAASVALMGFLSLGWTIVFAYRRWISTGDLKVVGDGAPDTLILRPGGRDQIRIALPAQVSRRWVKIEIRSSVSVLATIALRDAEAGSVLISAERGCYSRAHGDQVAAEEIPGWPENAPLAVTGQMSQFALFTLRGRKKLPALQRLASLADADEAQAV